MVSSNKKIFLYIIFSFYISTATLVFTVLIIIRESFQAIISARMYFCNLENVMEVIMLGISLYLVAGNGSVMTKNTRNLSAAAILFCWFEMFLMAGRHPKLSNYIKMFKMVSLKFLVVLLWYGTFGILSFGLAFYFILKREDTGESEEENAYFKTPPNSILKTAVMSLTGELEFEGMRVFSIYLLLFTQNTQCTSNYTNLIIRYSIW